MNSFQVVVLGCTGGPREGNLSGYLLSPLKQQEWIALDAGTLLGGIDLALEQKSLDAIPYQKAHLIPSVEFLRYHINAFLISHAHLDHIAALVLNSQIDTEKAILGIDPTIDNIRDHIFNGRIWPNYGDEGFEPRLQKYHYTRLPLHNKASIPKTAMQVEAHLLCHPGGYPSTAFLIEFQGDYVLYFGDTSPDSLENEKHLNRIWNRIASLISEKRMKGILIECSYPYKESDQIVFGHLDTKHLMEEMHHLSTLSGTSLKGLKVIVTHRKEGIRKGEDPLALIEQELLQFNDLKIDFIFPHQGERILL